MLLLRALHPHFTSMVYNIVGALCIFGLIFWIVGHKKNYTIYTHYMIVILYNIDSMAEQWYGLLSQLNCLHW